MWSICLSSCLHKIVFSQGVIISSVHVLLSPEIVLNDILIRFFQRASQPSNALTFSTLIFSENSMALVLKTRTETATSLL